MLRRFQEQSIYLLHVGQNIEKGAGSTLSFMLDLKSDHCKGLAFEPQSSHITCVKIGYEIISSPIYSKRTELC